MTDGLAKSPIPLVDIGPFRNGSKAARRQVAAAVGKACEEIGFLVIENHGLRHQLLADAFAVSREFFALPLAEKQRFMAPVPAMPRGYTAFASKNLGRTFGLDTPPDLREQYFVGPLEPQLGRFTGLPQAAPFYADNIWPDRPEHYRPIFTALYREMEALSGLLMRIFALALGLSETYFDDKIEHHFSTLPTNHYPPVAGETEADQLRAGAHTDFGSLTILAIDGTASGLQVRTDADNWHDVVVPGGSLVVNLGDMMARWTNDQWRSTVHRVANPSTDNGNVGRQSIGYFLHPNYDAEVTCLPGCTGPDNPPLYPPILAGEHMREKLERRVV